ncbi:MAG: patatin-like phospholipase family protein [Polyangiales bacterium]|nr:patatin-like phospholipase family protein [Myxococcales bacterium]MCB9661111.1 patatin-like phospholipase family protein [Sandaracinaceae bacterium]
MGKPRIAFVGSGGATKGVAHLGVLKAMEELALEPDIYVGASAGAIASAFYSQGFNATQLAEWARPFYQRRTAETNPLRARYFLGLPTMEQLGQPAYLSTGLFSIDRFERFMAEKLPKNDFRALDKDVFITAADIDGRGRVVFGRGHREDVPISQAVAASACVPLLFRPYRIGDRYYVDGELVRTLSIDLAVEAGADVVIISNVYRPHVIRPGQRSLVHQGGFSIGRQALNIVISEKEKRGIDLINRLYPHVTVLNVSADLGRFSFTSRANAKLLMTRGYREALRVLAAAKRRGMFDIASNVHTIGEA